MPVFKDEKTNKWYAMVRFTDWQGQRKQKCKRGFATRRDALEWEKVFQMQTTSDLDMSFEAFVRHVKQIAFAIYLTGTLDGERQLCRRQSWSRRDCHGSIKD